MFRSMGAAVVIVAVISFGSSSSAQQREFAAAQRANQAALRDYSWKTRTELVVDGESKNVRLEQVRYDLDGRLQKTTIGGSGAGAETRNGPPGPGGALKRRVTARKQEAFKDLLEELVMLTQGYAHLPADRLEALAAGATITKGQGVETGSLRVEGRNVLRAGDRMTTWIDPETHAIRRVEIATTHEGHPLSLVADYRNLGNGLTHQARSVLRYPEQQIELTVESFDYQFAAASR